ncbi:hypothetical protein M8PIadj_1324 [Bifidobacterium animalis]|uniref:Uncharacterized protein n=1 Tax=Bifidobacterium animalis subsp. lactis (strain AD011) TaxID=442563 RepID=B8DWF9_BIFA0|nr:hypothetical protein BLA_0511 [Bifidobacterium animalis subsp. lactis AD011]AJD34417.1 hypothetical protein BAA6_1304 [Bifidobacterium animalis]QIR81338.1 hypothetical protein M8PIadj_1324 [Bifidobacterium animalis]
MPAFGMGTHDMSAFHLGYFVICLHHQGVPSAPPQSTNAVFHGIFKYGRQPKTKHV